MKGQGRLDNLLATWTTGSTARELAMTMRDLLTVTREKSHSIRHTGTVSTNQTATTTSLALLIHAGHCSPHYSPRSGLVLLLAV